MDSPTITSAAIITTDKCTAACEECCFLCNPNNKNMLTFSQIKNFIDELKNTISSVQLIVFTGGEATLLGKTLIDAISYASTRGLRTRIVTNGWWAKNEKSAKRMIDKLLIAGLSEINFSTGDNHQEWIDLDTIINGCVASTERNLLTVVSVEAFDNAKFTMSDFFENSRIKAIYDKLEDKQDFQILSSPWVSIHKSKDFTHKSVVVDSTIEGCETILNYIGLDEQGKISACCGLTQKEIPAMNLSNLYPNLSIKEMIEEQTLDLLKIWIWVDGPKYIYDTIIEFDSDLVDNKTFIHTCEYCSEIYRNKQLQGAILNYLDKANTLKILNRYYLKLYYQNKGKGESYARSISDTY